MDTQVETLDTLTSKLNDYLQPDQVNKVRRAYFYAEQAHDGQLRRSGEPYVTHPLAVASILADMHMDHQSLMAAMLHDVIEDTAIEKPALSEQFGESVADLVDGVSKLTQIEFASKAEAQAENFQKMVLAMSEDIRVILVKLADRLHNMRTLGVLRPEKRRRIAKETLEIYAPIAARLGMNTIRVEFEDLGFMAMHPMRSQRISAAVKNVHGNRSELIEKVRGALDEQLKASRIDATVVGRKKHLYSIYKKMEKKRFSDIMDVYAFRIVVNEIDDCYRALGAVHGLYKPDFKKFKDYIASPKANGYQSLHTVLFGMFGVPIEIQIRTHEMEAMANNGIAAHWLYKSENDGNSSHTRARQWVESLLEMQQRAGNSLEFIENVKIDLFPDDIYIFSPRGDIMELPSGATPVDFAYAVHTDVGNSCVACRINRRLAPLSEPLESGQTVEVITAPGAMPNPGWLNFVATAKARSNIRHYLKTQRRAESISLGRRLLDKALNNLGSSYEDLGPEQIDPLLADAAVEHIDFILEEIGLGNRVAYLTARRLLSDNGQEVDSKKAPKRQKPMAIHGAEGVMINFAKCCRPIPGDPILGYISSGRGMVIHHDQCRNIADVRNNPEKCTQLAWDDDVEGEFLAELRIEYHNERGIVAVIAARLNALNINIEKISTEEIDAKFGTLYILIGVHSRTHLARVMRLLRKEKAVSKVMRVRR